MDGQKKGGTEKGGGWNRVGGRVAREEKGSQWGVT